MQLTIYLAGEIHSPWRTTIKEKAAHLPITFVGPVEDHDLSDHIGEHILGKQADLISKDRAASSINNLRTTLMLQQADLVIAKFGTQYKQWNTAMDASSAVSLNKPLLLIRPEEHHHALKELERKADVTVTTEEQIIQILEYVCRPE